MTTFQIEEYLHQYFLANTDNERIAQKQLNENKVPSLFRHTKYVNLKEQRPWPENPELIKTLSSAFV